jgi:hypothetical protein
MLNFKCLDCDISYKFDDNLDVKLHKSQSECGTVTRTHGNGTRQDTKLKFRTAIPALLYECDS